MDTTSPFSISAEESTKLEGSGDFQVVRTLLSNEQKNECCRAHSCLPSEILSTFTLHRDILHAVLLPICQIRTQAALYASSILSTRLNASPSQARRSVVDHEVAFRGQARSAFSWLQCFISQEQEWVLTQGCPACVVLKILHDEPFIRIVVAACRLSSYLQDLLQSHGTPSTLPDFSFWLTAVQIAVTEDSFWGLHFWTDIEARAISLESGIKELISQFLSRPAARSGKHSTAPPRSISDGASRAWAQDVQNGRIAKREMMLKQEEQQWMKKAIEACWSNLLTEAARERRVVSATKWQQQSKPSVPRKRSLTT